MEFKKRNPTNKIQWKKCQRKRKEVNKNKNGNLTKETQVGKPAKESKKKRNKINPTND